VREEEGQPDVQEGEAKGDEEQKVEEEAKRE